VTARRIEGFLVANAADTGNGEAEFLRGLRPTDIPLRITDTPLWRAIHPSCCDLAWAPAQESDQRPIA
jgi:hypothetical protein